MCASVSERGAPGAGRNPKGQARVLSRGQGWAGPVWDMDTVGWDAKGDWGCSRAAEKDKKAPAAPPARALFCPSVSLSARRFWGRWCR
ncbi:hypothetical protein PspLS_08597 [Pyricularia sp. CBS 133598]|nr:hypothetical protein PspLS_08597 [Pyricularia sp. CBS 133598]